MNKEVKALWLDALRSGDYVQGKYALRTEDNTFCCLGVLCDLAVKAGIQEDGTLTDSRQTLHEGVTYQYDDVEGQGVANNMLPVKVAKWAGIDTPGSLPRWFHGEQGEEFVALWELNDELNMSFGQIADVIEEQF